ncbi:MAG: hypothetical protein V1816_21460 [Pseudomonadota bacterium]
MYLPCLDPRQGWSAPRLDPASVGLLHLEILAGKQGAWTPWNRLE